jgi:hypothetical protein
LVSVKQLFTFITGHGIMSDEVTMEKLTPILSGISAQLKITNDNVLLIQKDLQDARKDISDTIRDSAVMTEKITNLKESNDGKHNELKSDIDRSFEYSRMMKKEHGDKIQALELKDSKLLGGKDAIILIIAIIGAIGTIYKILS